MYEWQERTAMLVGEEMLEHFRNSTVAVIGVGGVGGYAAEMIVRAGIGHLIILDSDDVSVTNKNRQLLALDSTVGRQKCDVLAERLKDINPELDLTVIKEYLEAIFTSGVTHHCIVGIGNMSKELLAVAELLKLKTFYIE